MPAEGLRQVRKEDQRSRPEQRAAFSHSLAGLVATMAFLLAQAVPASAQAFAVASIKPTEGQPVNSGFRRATPGALNATRHGEDAD